MAVYEQLNGVEDREEVPLPTRARKKTECPLPSTPQKHAGKAATKPSPKLQNLGPRSRCEQIHFAAGVEGRSGGEPFKMLHRQELRLIM